MLSKNWIKDEIRFLKGFEADAAERLAAAIEEEKEAEKEICLLQAHIGTLQILLDEKEGAK